jgi:hypothetical protein
MKRDISNTQMCGTFLIVFSIAVTKTPSIIAFLTGQAETADEVNVLPLSAFLITMLACINSSRK